MAGIADIIALAGLVKKDELAPIIDSVAVAISSSGAEAAGKAIEHMSELDKLRYVSTITGWERTAKASLEAENAISEREHAIRMRDIEYQTAQVKLDRLKAGLTEK